MLAARATRRAMPRPPQYTAVTRRSYSAGHFMLLIDGFPALAYVKSVEGGFPKLNSTEDAGGQTVPRVKHRTSLEFESITIEVGISQSVALLRWIQRSWDEKFDRQDGQIIHADQDYKAQFVQTFYGALIEEVTFPALDASSKDSGYLKVKLKPEKVVLDRGDGKSIKSEYQRYQKAWNSSAFRLNLDKDIDTSFINKIDSFTIKQGVKQVATGERRVAELEPTKLEFPDLKVTLSLAHADGLFAWYQKTVGRDLEKALKPETQQECTGSIEFLTPSRRETMLELSLTGVAIKSFTIPKSEANNDQIKRCVCDLSVESMKINENDIRMMLE